MNVQKSIITYGFLGNINIRIIFVRLLLPVCRFQSETGWRYFSVLLLPVTVSIYCLRMLNYFRRVSDMKIHLNSLQVESIRQATQSAIKAACFMEFN